ncbi:MAG: IclR family transcriptional regulator [Rhodospirillales bacterium]|nr:IclR family transcriptional regulator [Rhodospirillales bacterium]
MGVAVKRVQKGIQSIEVGYAVLRVLEHARGPLPLGEVAKAAGMSASKAHSYLVSFARVGLVTQDPITNRYGLGAGALRLGLSAMAHIDLLTAARAAMYDLVDATGQTVFLSVWGNLGPTVIARLEGANLVPVEVKVGTVMPMLISATGRAFLAFMPHVVTDPLIKPELKRLELAKARGQPAQFDWSVIEEAKRHGVSRALGHVMRGFGGFAAPIFDHEGQVSAVITVIGDMNVIDARFEGPIARRLLHATKALSRQMGYVEKKAAL